MRIVPHGSERIDCHGGTQIEWPAECSRLRNWASILDDNTTVEIDMFFPMWKRAAVCLACVGMVAPQAAMASDKLTQSPTRVDVSLTAGGTLNGSVVNAAGEAQAGVPVTVRFKGHTVARAKTNTSGRFAVSGLRSGLHEVVTPVSHTTQRLWSADTAPKSAKTAVVVRPNTLIVRGQDDG